MAENWYDEIVEIKKKRANLIRRLLRYCRTTLTTLVREVLTRSVNVTPPTTTSESPYDT